MLETMSKYLNFTYEILDCNMIWGTKPFNGTNLKGIIGKVSQNVRLSQTYFFKIKIFKFI